ncbi:MerR family transcriptional regulator [Actinoplanes siamensis]|uniref:HTH merR-type domain-containing protein n=1 Tax=Actinoplanes siamensis TaxID=1223317 RepID=A0A919ND06_9ACTN|nr:MerR family transcriptional regulator [Actinoplanes siamensis]GIF08495.1 hypothetical protein Asi03nite_60330 [Actinoplanes siamensis]
MRISELSRRTGIPVATIKFYLRERLLFPGHPTGRNQARYGVEHLRRLLLIRILTGFGDMDLATVRSLLAAMSDPEVPLIGLYTAAARRVGPPEPDADDEAFREALADTLGLAGTQGWTVGGDCAAVRHFAQVLVALRQLGCAQDLGFFEPFAQAADRLAEQELALLHEQGEGGEMDAVHVRAAALARAVVFEVAFATLRQIALQSRLTPNPANTP